MKRLSKYFVLSILAALVVSACAAAPAAFAAGSPVSSQQANISVSGSGRVFVIPDTAYINVGVRSQADTVVDALEQNKIQAQAIKDVLVDSGIAEEDIQTTNFNVYPQSDYDFQGNITRTYFSVENTVYITVRDLDALGNTLDAVARSGANNIYGINFDVLDKSEARSDAREKAVLDARKQAEELAAAAGVNLGDLLSISTANLSTIPFYGYGIGGGGGAAEAFDAVPISSGQIPVNVSVTMVFAIE